MSVFDDSPATTVNSPPLAATRDTTSRADAQEPTSEAVRRFQTCRWRKPPEDGAPDCCGHRDVLPLTGTKGFDPEAWCSDCRFYKLRRTPKKRSFADEPFWRP